MIALDDRQNIMLHASVMLRLDACSMIVSNDPATVAKGLELHAYGVKLGNKFRAK